MRAALPAVLLALVIGCTDRSLPTVARDGGRPATQSAPPPGKPVIGPRIPLDPTPPDGVPPLARIETLVGASLTQIPIPADAFSRATDAVHPDVACRPAPWNGARCWVAYTPYAGSDASWENPSFLTMAGDAQWLLPAGVTNPVVPWPGYGAYNSDPDQAFDPGTGRLVTFYREVDSAYNNIYITSTGDGRQWSPAHLAFRELNHDAVSPAVVIAADRTARVWYVQSGAVGCNSSASRIRMRAAQPVAGQRFEDASWSAPHDVKLTQPGYVIWHMDVIELPGRQGYLAIMADHASTTTCSSSDLWIALSSDGVAWHTFAVPVLWRAMPSAKRLGIRTWYRAALRYDLATDSLHIWPSALNADNRWVIFHTAVNLTDLVRVLLAATAVDEPAAQLRVASIVPARIRNRMP